MKIHWRLALLAVLLLGAALRLTDLDLAEFKADEAGIARQALALVREGKFPAVGPSSSQGPAHPPLQIFLMALPFAFTQDPRLAVALIALIHTAAIGMAYVLGARFFHRRVGLIAAFLFAVNPWAIYYARKIWTQNWPLATTVLFFCLLLLILEKRPWALLGAGLSLVALVGTHLGGLALIVAALLILPLFRSRVQRRPLLLGMLIFLLLAAPYLVHDATHDWANLRRFFDLGGGQGQVDLQAARFAIWLSSGFHYQDLAGARYMQFLDRLPELHWLDVVEMVLLVVGFTYLVARIIRHAKNGRERWDQAAGRDVVLLAWLLVPVLLQTRHSQPVYPHYFILLYPVQHLIIALLLSDGLEWFRSRRDPRWQRWYAVGVTGLLIAVGAWQVYLEQTFVHFVERFDTPDGYGPILGPLRRTASLAGEAATLSSAEVLIVASGDDWVWDNLPAAFDVLLPRDLSHRFVDGRNASVFSLQPTVYIVSPDLDEVATAMQAQTGADLIERVASQGEEAFWIIERSNKSRDDVIEGMIPFEPPQRLANGVELLAYQIEPGEHIGGSDEPRPDQRILLTLGWWLSGPAPVDVDYHAFAHLIDDSGQLWGQHDLSSFPTTSWHTGDLILTRFQIEPQAEAPPGEYWVRLGMYSFPDVSNVPVLDVAGNPADDSVQVGPIELR